VVIVKLWLALLLRLPVEDVVMETELEPEPLLLRVPEPEEEVEREPVPLVEMERDPVPLPLLDTDTVVVIVKEFVIVWEIVIVAPEASLTRTRRRKVTRA